MKVIDFLKQKSTRVIAFISACVIFAVCAVCGLSKVFSLWKIYDRYDDTYMKSSEGQEEAEELFAQLWAVGNMYLRNLDENGKFTGSKEFQASTEKALQELGLMDSKGHITIKNTDNFDYYVSWGNNSISTDNRSYDDIFKSNNYSTTQINGSFSHSQIFGYFNYKYFRWYTTDYGMTYYDFPHTINGVMASAVFDYDTTDLDYYIDNYGVKIYYKKDGSTPVLNPETPYSYNNVDITIYNNNDYDEYNEYYYEDEYSEFVEEATVPKSEEIEEVTIPAHLLRDTDDNSYILYNRNENEWVKVRNGNRQNGNEVPLKICVSLSGKILPIYQKFQNELDTAENNITNTLLRLIPFLALAVVLMGFFVVTSGYDVKKKKFVMSRIDNIWAEVVIAVIAGLGVAVAISLDMLDSGSVHDEINDYQIILTELCTIAWTVIFALGVLCVNSIIKRFKCRSFWKTTLLSRIWKIAVKILKIIWRKIKSVAKTIQDAAFKKDMLDNNLFARRFLIKLGVFIFATLFAASINAEFTVWVIIFAVYIYASLKDIKAVTELSRQIDDIYGGDYSAKEVHKDSPTYTMTEKLNNISDGIQKAVDKKLQSEKMKIDLVTNVSHDLKTPLTSIISYINLLSMEKDLSPVARDYVKILEQKSERLREIVADVFDIAKATSRTDINFEMIDAVILMEQVLADMSDRIETSGKEIRKTISAENAPVYADGKRLYRVLQNLIDNALKYSLDNTRIYLTLNRDSGNAIIKIKNISSYEIKFTPEEITERFTRGDESRTTEGSGLGLSIAKSFTEACGGKFEITIDGDVFEATVELPITIKDK